MTWSKQGTLEYFNGGHMRDVSGILPSLADTDLFGIETTTVRSGLAAIRVTKTASDVRGVRHMAFLSGRSSPCTSIVIRIDSYSIASGEAIHWCSYTPTAGNFTPDLAWYYNGTNLKLRIMLGTTVLWESATNFSTDVDYIIRFMNRNPRPGVASDLWRGFVTIADSSAAELERSPFVMGVSVAATMAVSNLGFGAWTGNYQTTSNQIDYIIDTFTPVSGGALSPRDVKTAVLYPDSVGSHDAWVLVAGASKVDAVDDPAAGAPDGDTTYIVSNGAAALRQSFIDSGGSGISLSGAETVMGVMPWVCGRIASGTGIIICSLYDAGVEGSSDTYGHNTSIGGVTWVWRSSGPYVRRLSAGTSRLGGDAGSGFSVSDADALEFGPRRGAFASNDRRVTAALCEILYGLESDDVDLGIAGEMVKAS